MEIRSIPSVPAAPRDVVGYTYNLGFVILNPVKADGERPDLDAHSGRLPMGISCIIKNNQVIKFLSGGTATLHDINNEWHYRLDESGSQIRPLESDRFFEIVDK